MAWAFEDASQSFNSQHGMCDAAAKERVEEIGSMGEQHPVWTGGTPRPALQPARPHPGLYDFGFGKLLPDGRVFLQNLSPHNFRCRRRIRRMALAIKRHAGTGNTIVETQHPNPA